MHYGKHIKKLKMELLCDPAILLLGIYPKKMKTLIQKQICDVFIAALFTVATVWEQLKCPSMDEWVKKLWHIYIQWNVTQS